MTVTDFLTEHRKAVTSSLCIIWRRWFQWITPCHKNCVTTRVITFWRLNVTSRNPNWLKLIFLDHALFIVWIPFLIYTSLWIDLAFEITMTKQICFPLFSSPGHDRAHMRFYYSKLRKLRGTLRKFCLYFVNHHKDTFSASSSILSYGISKQRGVYFLKNSFWQSLKGVCLKVTAEAIVHI